ncbi:hypothetical protein ASE12_18070 [Aeromicrobium sp. Root236]|uniref:carboxypeptidase regulatory-like domain-containing protein n=1 Tax=Aeromicrobium sp. Root236 TaxID=1736498 RepID=UPI0007001A50|nr:carboxypeptidase regulatory-like domain-containing protein [Aeromicrobium sp. Root236]KRC66507.1 hypothetical protein ASE12_18070 [Aeromicrobium sp. Root236]
MKHLVRTSALLTLLVALLTLGLVVPSTAATSTGYVKGVVTLDGAPLKGATIELYYKGDDGYEGPKLAVDTTDSKGAYSFTINVNGLYGPADYLGHTILIKDSQHRIVATSRSFTGLAGKTVTRNATVTKAATITGSVKRGDGVSTQNLRVNVFGPSKSIDPDRDLPLAYDEVVSVASDGSFALYGLPAGDYNLGFTDAGKTYFPQCYDSAPFSQFCEDATVVHVDTGQKLGTNPQVMTTKGSRIAGTVTDTSGRPIAGAYVIVETDKGDFDSKSTSTGAFKIGPLTDGTYELDVNAPSPWVSAGAVASVDVAGKDVQGVQIKLKSKAFLTATITPGKGTATTAFKVIRRATGMPAGGSVTVSWQSIAKTVKLVNGKGTVKLTGLPKGRRKITFTFSGSSSTAPVTNVVATTVK